MRRGVLLLGLLALAPLAAAHGQSITVERNVGPYHVIFYTYNGITENETVRLAWNVTDASSGQRVQVDHPQVEVAWKDTHGTVVNDSVVPLQEKLTGFLYEDFRTGPEGSATFTLPLPGGQTAGFDQQIYPWSTYGRYSNSTPGVPLALGLAAAALAGALLRTAGRSR